MIRHAALVFTFLLLLGCNVVICSNDDCTDEINDIVAIHGVPDEIEVLYEQDEFFIKTYWYHCKGVAYTFSYMSHLNSCSRCEVSVSSFAPTC